MKPTVTFSEELGKVLERKIKAKLLKQCRTKSLWYGTFANQGVGALANLMAAMSGEGLLTRPLTYGTAEKSTRRSWVFLFDGDESSAIEFAETQIVRGKVPHKILVRMVVSRLEKTHDRALEVPFSRRLLTPEGFQEAVTASQKKNRYLRDQVPWMLKDIEYLLKRDEMNQAIFDEAWELWKVKQVMVA
jgi:hypothetical protein